MSKKWKCMSLCLLVFLFGGCTPLPQDVDTPLLEDATAIPTPSPSMVQETKTPEPEVESPTETPEQPTPTDVIPEPTQLEVQAEPTQEDLQPSIEYQSGDLWVRIFSLEDDETVEYEPVDLVGEAPENTVLTINDEIILVEEEQRFTLQLALEEGPNVIEVVASDFEGNELAFTFVVYYEEDD